MAKIFVRCHFAVDKAAEMYINNYYDADYSYYFNKINLTLIFANIHTISGRCGSDRITTLRHKFVRRIDGAYAIKSSELSDRTSIAAPCAMYTCVYKTIRNALRTIHFKYAHTFRIDGCLNSKEHSWKLLAIAE